MVQVDKLQKSVLPGDMHQLNDRKWNLDPSPERILGCLCV